MSSFHPGMQARVRAVAWSSGVDVTELAATAAARHDHAVGEVHIIGQLRTALTARTPGAPAAARPPSPRGPCASRSTRTPTDLDHVSPGLVAAGLASGRNRLADPAVPRHVVVGAGSINGVTAAAPCAPAPSRSP